MRTGPDKERPAQEAPSHACGCQKEVFSPDAVSEVFRYSRGVPRMINRACMAGLTYAASRETRRVNGLEMKEIIDKELS